MLVLVAMAVLLSENRKAINVRTVAVAFAIQAGFAALVSVLYYLGIMQKVINVIGAAAAGAVSGMKLAVNIGAMLMAFIALIALVNDSISALGGLLNFPTLTLQKILGL